MANEIYRQSVHLAVGVLAGLAAFVLPKGVFLAITGLLALLTLLVVYAVYREFRWVYRLLEREHVPFKGKGAFFFMLGIFLTAALFWEHAGVAILVLAIADAAATLVGSFFRSARLPYNRRKTVLGSAAFFFAAVLVLSVARFNAGILFIAFLLTALESFDYKEIPFLDDNVVVPVVAAYLLSLLQAVNI
jgi:phytol kinase